MDYTFDINIEIEDCINEYKKYFKIEETEETIYKVLLNEKELLEESQKYANKITKTNTSEEKFSIGALIMYGYRIGAYIERNKSVCLERQNGYKSTPIYSYNVDSILNVKTISEDASLDELVNWIINPGSNLEIVDEVFKQMVSPVVKMLSRITPQNKKINLQLFIPPFSKLIEFNKWNELLSKYFDNKTEISIMNYGSLLELEKNKRSYIIMYTGENENSKIIISAYELLRGKPLCLGTLAFDLYSNNIFELHNVNEYTFEKDETHQELIRKNNAIEVKDVLKPLKLNYEKIIGYKSFLANHPSGFYDERFQYTEEDDELNPVLDSIKLYQSISPIDVCIKNINETNINHISLGDVMYISDIMEKNPCFKKANIRTKRKINLGTSKNIASEIDMDSLFYIPSNYEMIEWELIDKNCKIVEYNELNNSNTIKEQVLSIVKFYGHPSTQQIAEDLLFIENDDQNIDPSALLIAKIFVLLSSYDELKIVKKKEVRILEENIDANIYKTEKVIKSGVIKKKKIPINTIPIETLNLQARLLKTLKRGKIHTLNDLLFTPQDKLAKIRNIKKRDIELLNKIICKYK